VKRSVLTRKSPLLSKSPLKPGKGLTRLGRTASERVRSTHRSPKPQRSRPRATGPTAAVRKLVRLRSDGWCEWPGCWLVAAEQHHRLNRKNGGRHGEMAERINQAAWLLDACRLHHDAVTSPHGEARVLARQMGWLLHEGEDAREVAVLTRHGRVWLHDDGTTTEVKR
jgi:hypothetical protein